MIGTLRFTEKEFFPDPSDSALSEESLPFQTSIWQILKRQVRLYTMGESSSLPKETVEELFSSICFLIDLGAAPKGKEQPLKLQNMNAEELFELGKKRAEWEVRRGKRLWKTACMSAPKISNRSLFDTLQGIGVFWKKYDVHFFAHQIPCYIDYQLMNPVPESLSGICYLNEYLHRLLIENRFLLHFDVEQIRKLLKAVEPDYQELLINLTEPVVIQAIGLSILKKEPYALDLSPQDLEQLQLYLQPLSEKEMRQVLSDAALWLCGSLKIEGTDDCAYFLKTAQDAFPRLSAACCAKELQNLFPHIA
jgi:hypothetical protein